MASMRADGCELQLCTGATALVALGDEVELLNGLCGVAFNWTRRGVAVRIDQEPHKPICRHLLVLAFDVGDCEIQRIIRRQADRVAEMAVADAAASRPWTTEEILRNEG